MTTETNQASQETVSHTPGPWEIRLVDPEWCAIARVGFMPHATVNNPAAGGSLKNHMRPEDNANARLIAAAPDLLASLLDLLADVTGPAMVYGNGIGNDGKKTGLTHQEFNELRAARIANARAAIARAEGK